MVEVKRLWEGAAEQELKEAQYNLSVMYKNGEGVDQSDTMAMEWTEKAAEQGHAGAQYNLGLVYYKGHGVDQDDSMAMRWYAKAAAQGFKGAEEEINKILTKRRASKSKYAAASSSAPGE